MRRLRVLALSMASVFMGAGAVSALSIERVLPHLMDKGDFTTIGEYFSGEEEPGNRTILRSEPDERDGYYFIVKLDEAVADLPKGASVLVDVIPASDGQRESLRLPLSQAEPRGHYLYVGLTGGRWSQSPALLAWRLRIVDSQDQPLAEEQSFLWELP